MEFDVLIRTASEIQQAKDNCLDAGSSSMCKLSGQEAGGGKKPKACYNCNKTTHSDKSTARLLKPRAESVRKSDTLQKLVLKERLFLRKQNCLY